LNRQRGVAFILVLWLLALLAILLGSFTLLARSDSLQARHHYDTVRARYAAEAGIAEAVHALAQPDPLHRWLPDGRRYTPRYHDAELVISIVDESGKLDINAADVATLATFFEGQGLDLQAADALAAAIIDWRDPDELITPNGAELDEYESAGLDYGPTNLPFAVTSELQQVLGMDYELFARVEPYVTIFSGQAIPNLAFAPPPVLQIFLPDMDPELVRQLIEQRHAFDPNSNEPPPLLPDGSPAVATAGTGTYSIAARATLPNGAWTELDVTVRLGGAPSGLAYTVLRWQEGKRP
jgi:general secretion pathway protein K